MLRVDGWGVSHKRVERLWRQEGPKGARHVDRGGEGCGSTMVPVSGYGLSITITSGRMTSCSIERVRGGP